LIKREKRRYLSLKIETNQTFNEQAILDSVYASLHRLFGEVGTSKANIKLIESYPEKNQLIIRCSHLMLEKVRAATTSIVEINKKMTAIHVLDVSGTLKALSKKIKKKDCA
jgi:RNase P/RNase MRP subunit POP5